MLARGCAADTSQLQGPGDMNSLSGEASGLPQSYCIRPLHPYMGGEERDAGCKGRPRGEGAALWGEKTLYRAKSSFCKGGEAWRGREGHNTKTVSVLSGGA